MPCILKVHIEAARGLPAIDKTSELVDAYVEIRFGDLPVERTSICRKTLSPVWGEDFRLEVPDDSLLHDEPLELRLFDFDAISADDAVGIVSIDLNPLLSLDSPNQMAGWFPIYDTIRGARGELWAQVKLEFFENMNPFKDSSAGIHFFSSAGIPAPFVNATIIGLVDEVITEVDPDYHWSDSFRTFRSSNEASQKILTQMSCRLRRQMGRKAVEMGGNAILAYNQWIDIETYAQTITLRGLGTAAILEEVKESSSSSSSSSPSDGRSDSALSDEEPSLEARRRSLRIPRSGMKRSRPPLDLLSRKIELATVAKIPGSGSILACGGLVSAKSVKLISEEPQYDSAAVRDGWLRELREEIRSHARVLGCNIVLGYRESVVIHDTLYILCAEGTACRVARHRRVTKRSPIAALDELSSAEEGHQRSDDQAASGSESLLLASRSDRPRRHRRTRECTFCHIPKRHSRVSRIDTDRCNVCRKGLVPEILLTTTEIYPDLEVFGASLLVESYVCRPLRRKKEAEPTAMTVSANLPFIEYELYRQLQFKLRYHGLNAIFGLRYQVLASDKILIAVASGTGVCVASLPQSRALQIARNIGIKDAEDVEIFHFQEKIAQRSAQKHHAMSLLYEDRFSSGSDGRAGSSQSSSSEEEDSSSSSSSGSSGSDSSSSSDSSQDEVVQIDDEADEDLLLTLVEPRLGESMMGGNCDIPPIMDALLSPKSNLYPTSHFACNFRRFAVNVDDSHPNSTVAGQFKRLYDDMAAQFRGVFAKDPLIHCVRHQLNLVRSVELQIVTTAVVFGLVAGPVATTAELLGGEPKGPARFGMLGRGSEGEAEMRALAEEREGGTVPHTPFVHFTTGTIIPRSVFVSNRGTVTLQLFKEIYFTECTGGFAGFVSGTIADMLATARASAASLGGNALTSIAFRPAAFYENFKSQLHAVVSLTADVLLVELDHPDVWQLAQAIP